MIVCDNVNYTSVSTVNALLVDEETIASKLAACNLR